MTHPKDSNSSSNFKSSTTLLPSCCCSEAEQQKPHFELVWSATKIQLLAPAKTVPLLHPPGTCKSSRSFPLLAPSLLSGNGIRRRTPHFPQHTSTSNAEAELVILPPLGPCATDERVRRYFSLLYVYLFRSGSSDGRSPGVSSDISKLSNSISVALNH